MNWFGVKFKNEELDASENERAGIGKYLNVNPKRPREPEGRKIEVESEADQKRRKTGFGNFASW